MNIIYKFTIGTKLSIEESKEKDIPYFYPISGYVMTDNHDEAMRKVYGKYFQYTQYGSTYIDLTFTDIIVMNNN